MKVLEKIHSELGDWALKDMHCHVEGIEFDENGEKRHLNFSESGFDVKGLAEALKESGASGIIICESPSLEYDALYLKEILS
jgi:deoxyribonuclease-4